MDITGRQHIAAPRQRVWDALNDPAVLQACLPGCNGVERTAPDQFKVAITSAIGPLRARFTGSLEVTEADPPSSCVLVFEGQGGAVGFGKGSSGVTLADAPDGGTELAYAAKAQVGGKLAQVGSRLIDGVVRKMSDDFFAAFRREVAPEAAVAAPATAVAAAAPATQAPLPTGGAPLPVAGVPWWVVPLAFAAGLLVGLCF